MSVGTACGALCFLNIESDLYFQLQDECSEAEEEKIHEMQHQCQPLQEDLTGSNNTDCIANRTRQRTRLNESQTGYINSDKNKKKSIQNHVNKSGAENNHKKSLENKINNQNGQNFLIQNNIIKSNGAVLAKKDDTQTSSIKVR